MWPFKRKNKAVVQVAESTPTNSFEKSVMHTALRALEKVWGQTDEIDEMTSHIEHLIETRSQRMRERADLVRAVNKQRKLFGLEEVNDEGRTASEIDDDFDDEHETAVRALESE